jgi:hypothetical protein
VKAARKTREQFAWMRGERCKLRHAALLLVVFL